LHLTINPLAEQSKKPASQSLPLPNGLLVNRSTKQIGVILCLMAMSFFAGWPFWKWLNARAVSRPLFDRAKTLVENHPALEPAWTIAMQDEVLTWSEAKVIAEAAGEKIEPER
jgi:hypothetical protein